MFNKHGTKYQEALITLSEQNIKYILKCLQNNLQIIKAQHKSTYSKAYNQIDFWKNIKSIAENFDTSYEK